MKKQIQSNTWVEISKKALVSNVTALKKHLPAKTQVMAVVKANAYGHGQKEIVSILAPHKAVDQFAVFDWNDAVAIRKQTAKPILVLCSTSPYFWETAASKNISITISTFDQLKKLRTWHGKKLRVHIKVDTGLGRQGFLVGDIHRVMALVSQCNNILVEGLYTHFSGTESKKFDTYTKMQFEQLLAWKHAFADIGIHPLIHAGATSGSLRHADLACDIARLGIGIYGLWPSEETQLFTKNVTLKPVLEWKTYVSEIKEVKAGSAIAYDCTYVVPTDTTIAIVPVGYWDGLPRTLSSHGVVLVAGREVPIIGRIMMNMCVIDITGVPGVREGTLVTLIGQDKHSVLSAEKVADLAGTINYEIVTRINPLIPRHIS